MKWELLLASALIAFSSVVSADETFSPYLLDTGSDPVCSFALEHYSRQFESGAEETIGVQKTHGVTVPSFEVQYIDGDPGNYKVTRISIESQEKVIVYYERSHGWKGEVYTGYMFSPDDSRSLAENLKEADVFYPMGSLKYGSDFSWWENLPFELDGKWYVLTDFQDFYRHDSVRDVYQIHSDGSSSKVCSVKIFENFDSKDEYFHFPFFSAYKKSVEKIMLSPGGCGTSRPEAYAKSNGQLFASMAIVRPWAVEPTWDKLVGDSSWRIDFQKKHFDDWKYQDIWSFREYRTFEYLKRDAVSELARHYVENYNYSEVEARELAAGIVQSLPGRYYSLGVYYNKDKDFSFFDDLMRGSYQDFNRIEEDLKLKHGSIPLVSLSLILDIPSQYQNLPQKFDYRKIESKYGKDLLMYAAHMNNFDSVKYFIDAGWPVDDVTTYKPAHFCDEGFERLNRSALTYAAENASIELIKLLVDAGFDTEIKDSQGNTLDYYIARNPRFSDQEVALGFDGLIKKYSKIEPAKPGFSCQAKLNRIESAICGSQGLAIYDRELNKAYREVIRIDGMAADLKDSQINWIRQRTKDCGSAPDDASLDACLARSYRSRIRYLEYVKSAFGDKT